MVAEEPDLAPHHVGRHADLACVRAGRERYAETDRSLRRCAMPDLDQVLTLALDRRQAREGPIDVGHHQGRHEPGSGRRHDLDRGLVRQPRVLDRGHARGGTSPDRLTVLGVCHHLTIRRTSGRDDAAQLVLTQLRRTEDILTGR